MSWDGSLAEYNARVQPFSFTVPNYAFGSMNLTSPEQQPVATNLAPFSFADVPNNDQASSLITNSNFTFVGNGNEPCSGSFAFKSPDRKVPRKRRSKTGRKRLQNPIPASQNLLESVNQKRLPHPIMRCARQSQQNSPRTTNQKILHGLHGATKPSEQTVAQPGANNKDHPKEEEHKTPAGPKILSEIYTDQTMIGKLGEDWYVCRVLECYDDDTFRVRWIGHNLGTEARLQRLSLRRPSDFSSKSKVGTLLRQGSPEFAYLYVTDRDSQRKLCRLTRQTGEHFFDIRIFKRDVNGRLLNDITTQEGVHSFSMGVIPENGEIKWLYSKCTKKVPAPKPRYAGSKSGEHDHN